MKKSASKKGDAKLAVKGVIAMVVILLVLNFFGLHKKAAGSAFETTNKFTDDIGLDRLLSIPNIITIKASVKGGALLASWTANKDGQRVIGDAGTDIRATFLLERQPDAALETACVAYKLPGNGNTRVNEMDSYKAKGFTCEVEENAKLQGWNGKAQPVPAGDYTINIALKEKGDSNFGESKETTFKFFNSRYIETYRFEAARSTFCGKDCDVVGKKESALGNDKLGWCKVSDKNCDGIQAGTSKTYAEMAYEKLKSKFLAGCILQPSLKGEARISGCVESDVDMMYTEVVTEYAKNVDINAFVGNKRDVTTLLAGDCSANGWMDGYKTHRENGIRDVCNSKNKLQAKLKDAGWNYVAG